MPRIEGALEADSLDAPATVAAAIGLPARRADSGDAWSTAPFATGASELAGRIEFKAQRATLASALIARQLRGVARFAPASLVFDEVTGEFGNGRLDGRLEFANSAAGLSAGLKLAVTGAEANAMFGEGERPPLAGRVTLQVELAGSGRSPAAFIGSLAGSGSIRLERAQLSGLNPSVFDTVVRAAELGMPIEGSRLREFVTGVLDGSSLQVSRAEAAINVNAGQARFSNIVLRPAGADLEVAANVDLSAATLDAQLTLTGLPVAQGAARPSVLVTLKGELPAPRRSIDTGPLTSWLTLRAVEQQSRQIDAMERVGREMAPSAVRDAPPAPPPARTRETAPAASDPASPMNDAPPLPPPIEIPAAPKPPTAPQTAPRAEGRAPPPASPASRPGLIGSQH
jgi:large subunit ribosomal protein L24